MDGKTVRRSGHRRHDHGPLHVVSAWASGPGLALGQRAVEGKSNEIVAIPELLETLHLEDPAPGRPCTWKTLHLEDPAPGRPCTWRAAS